MSLLIEAPGLLTTVQDLGRQGYQHLGITPGGAMDEVSHRMANLLVGNPAGAATLEITLAGPTVRFEADALIALCGADLSPTLEGLPLPRWRPVLVPRGSLLRFGQPREGCRCYLAVAGGFQIPAVLGSLSTHLSAGFGGFQGRPLKSGDRLDFGPHPRKLDPSLWEALRQEGRPFGAPDWFAPWFRELDFVRPATLRFISGPQWASLTAASGEAFFEETFRVAPQADRMGIRMLGPRLALAQPLEMVSSGVATGTIQLPPDGSPILLMADRQTTGGYPRLGELASVDLPRAAQLRPGDTLRFAAISLAEAQQLYLDREARFLELERALAARSAP